MLRELAEWTKNRADYADVAKMLAEHVSEAKLETKRPAEGFVHLIRWGVHYKIGRGDQLERRVKQVKTGLPDSETLIHRFAEKRAPPREATRALPLQHPGWANSIVGFEPFPSQ